MKKFLSPKRVNIGAVLVAVLMLMCALFNASFFGHINKASAGNLATYSQTLSGLELAIKNAQDDIDAITYPTTALIDWTEVEGLKSYYKELIAGATSVGEVNSILQAGIIAINDKIDLEKARAAALTSSKIKPPAGYIGDYYIIVADYYKQLIRQAATINDIDGYVTEVEQKYTLITEFEQKRNEALEDIASAQPNPAELATYVKLIADFKGIYTGRIEDIEGELDPSGDAGEFSNSFNLLLPQISDVVSDFEQDFQALVGDLLIHATAIEQAVSAQNLVTIVEQVFSRTPNITPFTVASSVSGAVAALGYTDSVAEQAASIVSAHVTAVNNIKAEINTQADLADIDSDIEALETLLRTNLSNLKTSALAEEAAVANDKAEAARVDALINGLSKNSSYDEIKNVRMEYEWLTETQKSYVTGLDKLKDLEQLKQEEGPIIMWGVILIVITLVFIAMLSAFLFVVAKRRNSKKK